MSSWRRELAGQKRLFKGGGGSQTSTSTSGIHPKFVPYYENVLGIATARIDNQFDDEGNLIDPTAKGIVADLSTPQKQGLAAQQGLAYQALSGTGLYDDKAAVQRSLQNYRGNQTAAALGTLGSARSERAIESALADKAYDFITAKQQQAEAGAQSLQDAGSVYQEQAQKVLDAPYTELQRYSNVAFGNAPTQTTTTTQGGGGGK